MLPNYKDGSIVNLMSSIMDKFNKKSPYKKLNLDLKERNTVLIVIDGLGEATLNYHSKNGILNKNKVRTITSVFPATTAAAITTFITGMPPQQSGLLAWEMNMKELGMVFEPLRCAPRLGGLTLGELGIDFLKFYNLDTLSKKIPTYTITPDYIIDTEFNIAANIKAKVKPYKTLKQMFDSIEEATKIRGKKLIFAYTDTLDTLSHIHGYKHKKIGSFLKKVEKLVKKLPNTDIIITADHGFINVEKTINMNKVPEFMDCLTIPLCGEGRAAFCYVRPSKVKKFKQIYNKYLKKYATLHTGEELIKKGYFGIGKEHEKLFDRVGDFVLIAKKYYYLKDYLFGQEQKSRNMGHHGGTSKEEMIVPLIHIK